MYCRLSKFCKRLIFFLYYCSFLKYVISIIIILLQLSKILLLLTRISDVWKLSNRILLMTRTFIVLHPPYRIFFFYCIVNKEYRTDITPRHLKLRHLSLFCLLYTALLVCRYNCRQSRRGEASQFNYDGGVLSVL